VLRVNPLNAIQGNTEPLRAIFFVGVNFGGCFMERFIMDHSKDG